ncbi:Crp/Fnr family transcriptional regulator [Mucilaginibacter pedocola]|uniref:Crp/Fnr family transcriptional regulator n=1 Tax=Mucilaginibacter pedocola TaxID=1792845 RepID=A0A1S9PKF0_9SPHI|nr:Crp/Fnr family transcriptional regulator [Mucilaginibacter pedocola]OOQ61427.1 Crp/Fnr family transcriptional regulator [Mucilaginibacter pedocola]
MFHYILANFAIHVQLNDAETARLVSVLQHHVVEKNDSLLQPGSVCRHVWFVNKGCLRVFNRDKDGEEHNVLFCPENWWASDMASFSNHAPAYYGISALETTEVFAITYQALEQLYVDVPKLERFFRILSQNGLSLFQYRLNANLSKTAEERYALFQKQYPGLEQRIAQKHIASYLGITPVFLSMLRNRAVR